MATVQTTTTLPSFVSNERANDIISAINTELSNGYGFVPLIGAGFSAPSGLPLIWEVECYLQRCIALSLGLDQTSQGIWDPRHHQWPSLVEATNYQHSTDDWTGKVKHLLHSAELNGSDQQYVRIIRQAHGAMYEWTSALQFLSRLVRHDTDTPDAKGGALFLESPQQDVIDACIRTIMSGKQPTLGHRMLAGLGGLMRLDIILTTNFDDLMERAFIEARNPLTVFDIHINSSLPPLSAVRSQRSLIKLHGDRYSLRADFTVDAEPTESDRTTFLSYLADLRCLEHPDIPHEHRNHLLVAGCSGKERRVKSFVTRAIEHFTGDFKVFWLCYCNADVDNARAILGEAGASDAQFQILRFPHQGLFLLQLYQTVRRCLPPSGIIFPSVSRLYVPPFVNETDFTIITKNDVFANLKKRAAELFAGQFPNYCKLIRLTGDSGIGVTPLASVFCQHVADSDNALWFDMNDISGTDDFFEKLLDAANHLLGNEQWMPVYVGTDSRSKGQEFRRIARRSTRKWYLFVNAREKPGANTAEADSKQLPNGWLDMPGTDVPQFATLLSELCGHNSPNVIIVIMYRNAENARFGNVLDSVQMAKPMLFSISNFLTPNRNIVGDVLRWAAQTPSMRRFLHALCLMQRTRYLATIWSSSCVGVATNEVEYQTQLKNGKTYLDWLDDLVRKGLIRRKAGGFIWMHSHIREELRKQFDMPRAERVKEQYKYRQHFEPQGDCGEWLPEHDAPDIHQQLAEWYTVVYSASDTPAAIFESVYHLCQAAIAILKIVGSRPKSEWPEQAIRWPPPSECVDNASALLQINSFRIQTRGYSRGSCRQLDYIERSLYDELIGAGDPLVSSSAKQLKLRCIEIKRNIAREVSEWETLNTRQSDILTLLLDGKKSAPPQLTTGSPTFRAYVLHLLSQKKTAAAGKQLLLPWLRWCRWQGMICVSDRRCKEALFALQEGIMSTLSIDHSIGARPEDLNGYLKMLSTSLCDPGFGTAVFATNLPSQEHEQVRIELLRHLVWTAAAHLHLLSVQHRMTGGSSGPAVELAPIFTLLSLGETIARSIIAHDKMPETDHASSVSWSLCRLAVYTSHAISMYAATVLDEETSQPMWGDSMAMLARAEGHLRQLDPKRAGSDLAIVELYRAESRLMEADAVVMSSGSEICRFAEWRKRDLTEVGFELPEGAKNELNGLLKVPSVSDDQFMKSTRKVSALIDDAFRFLSRAEQILIHRRRNVWWTTWFFERKLRAISMACWAKAFNTNSPIPFMGIEAAHMNGLSIVDELLGNAMRMIRGDIYRLAGIIDAYGDCAMVLKVSTCIRDSRVVVALRDRQRFMLDQHREAVKVLRNLEPEKIEREVELYVNAVKERAVSREKVLSRDIAL